MCKLNASCMLYHMPTVRGWFPHLGLVGEPKVDSEGRVYKTLEGLFSSEIIGIFSDGSHIRLVELDQVAVFFDTRRRY